MPNQKSAVIAVAMTGIILAPLTMDLLCELGGLA
jgi:hypothetical protein